MKLDNLPDFDDLPVNADAPADSTWGLWGPDDQLGTINLLTPEKAVAAARLVKKGAIFRLDTTINYAEPPLFARKPAVHTVKQMEGFFAHDDIIDNYNTQQGTQWDGLAHVGYPPRDAFYNGIDRADIHANGQLGIELWKDRIVGRGVLIDLALYREQKGTPLNPDSVEEYTLEDLEGAAKAQGVKFEGGDILLVRTGWLGHYMAVSDERRIAMSTNDGLESFGLANGREIARWLWNNRVAMLGVDNPAVETFPWKDMWSEALHHRTLGLLGLPIGEQFVLDDLAADCRADGVYEFMVVSAPLVLAGGVASPPNAVAIK